MARNSEKSQLKDFNGRLNNLLQNIKLMEGRKVSVGWADKEHEQVRAQPKAQALVKNAKRRKGKGEIVSNFDENFIGPGRKAASLATIAKVMNFGRAGGVAKDGHEYGAIPARPFVEVLYRKHMKPILAEEKKMAVNALKNGVSPETLQQQLSRFGVVAKGQLQRAMKDSNEYEANAPITIKGGWMKSPINGKPFYVEPKNSSRPLWNTGTLIKSVDFEIK